MQKKIKLITCKALAHLLEPMVGPTMERVILPISLHLNPDRLKARLIEEISIIEAPGWDIILGYGLCGRALEGVYSQKSGLILPKVDDCVGAILGSRERHKAILEEDTGCFFLEPSWINSDIDIFAQCFKGIERIPEAYRSQIIWMALKHYSKLALIDHDRNKSSSAFSICKGRAENYHLKFKQYPSNLSLLQDLSSRQWTSDRFIIVEPGRKIPFF